MALVQRECGACGGSGERPAGVMNGQVVWVPCTSCSNGKVWVQEDSAGEPDDR
jgi:hypothetical protein